MTVQDAPDLDLDAVAEHCYSAVFSDICDQFGRRHQTTRPGLRRFSGAGTLVGWARTFRSVAVDAAARALEKAITEDRARDLLLEGAKLADVWERFGVL